MARPLPAPPSVSVVVPTLQEETTIGAALDALLPRLRGGDELLLVDGGSRDRTVALAREREHPRLRVLTSQRAGRAVQMNLGAGAAQGEWLVFLHADTRLPEHGLDEVRGAESDWGYFPLRLDGQGVVLWATQRALNRRVRAWSTPSGDQAIFVRRSTFLALGGYPEVPLMEDLLLVDALNAQGPATVGRQPVVTSARRWQRRGPVRTVLRMWTLRAAFRLGVSPERLARHYAREVR